MFTVYIVYTKSYDWGATDPEFIPEGVFKDEAEAFAMAKKINGEVVKSYLK